MNTEIVNGVIVNYPNVGHERASDEFRQALTENRDKARTVGAAIAKALGPGWMAEVQIGNSFRGPKSNGTKSNAKDFPSKVSDLGLEA